LRILILTPEYDGTGGGIMTFYRVLVPALCAVGMSVHVIQGSAFFAAEEREVRKVGSLTIETLERRRMQHWWERLIAYAPVPGFRRHLAAAWAMWEQACSSVEPDAVEASDWGLLFVPPAIESTRPLIIQCHGSVGQISLYDPIEGEELQGILTRLIEKTVMPMATAMQTYSNANAAFWTAETDREVTMIRPAWKATNAAQSDPSDYGLVVGRLQCWKGPQVLCSALEKMGTQAPLLDWIGRDAPWGKGSRSAVAYLKNAYPSIWGTKVLHRAPVPQATVAQRQAVALFNLVPSVWDVFNFTAIEAMASGRPTIVSNGAGASELIEDGVNGYLFKTGDPEALVGTLERVLCEKRQRLVEIGRAARVTVHASFNPERVALQRVAAYRAAIEAFLADPPASRTGWMGNICHPALTLQPREMAFLDHLPLLGIAAHMAERLSRRIVLR